jgi:hypothetical protein
MNNHFGSSLLIKNYESEKYGSSGWITNVNELNDKIQYKLYPTNHSTISGGREYIALPINTKVDWKIKEQYNLH